MNEKNLTGNRAVNFKNVSCCQVKIKIPISAEKYSTFKHKLLSVMIKMKNLLLIFIQKNLQKLEMFSRTTGWEPQF